MDITRNVYEPSTNKILLNVISYTYGTQTIYFMNNIPET
jgi:hypothetical protein